MLFKMNIKISGEVNVEAEAATMQEAVGQIEQVVRQVYFGDLENVVVENAVFVTE